MELPIDALTPREIEILSLVDEGFNTNRIAAMLGISPGTVTQHLDHIYSKYGLSRTDVSPRTAAARIAREAGLFPKKGI